MRLLTVNFDDGTLSHRSPVGSTYVAAGDSGVVFDPSFLALDQSFYASSSASGGPLFHSPSSPNVLVCEPDTFQICCVNVTAGLIALDALAANPNSEQAMVFYADLGCAGAQLGSATITVTPRSPDYFTFVPVRGSVPLETPAYSLMFGDATIGPLLSGEHLLLHTLSFVWRRLFLNMSR